MADEGSQRYELFERLGEGGMAEVFLALDQRLGRKVVVKRLKPEFADNDHLVHMFVDEARIVAQLNHPRIIAIHDLGYDNKLPFMVLEWLKGWDLNYVFSQSRGLCFWMPLEWVLSVMVDACVGLHAAHTARTADGQPMRLVHRDISPHNLFITTRGNLKILDFGVAKASIQQHQTQIGTIKGKYSYMSPEQLFARSLDGRSDVFSLGIILHEFLTGRPLFDQGSFAEVFDQITEGQTPPAVRPGTQIPQSLIAVSNRALNRNRDLRYPSAREFGRALQSVLAEMNVPAPTPASRAHMVSDLLSQSPGPTIGTRPSSSTTTRIAVGRLQYDDEGPHPSVRLLEAQSIAHNAAELTYDDLDDDSDFALHTTRHGVPTLALQSSSWSPEPEDGDGFWRRTRGQINERRTFLRFASVAAIAVFVVAGYFWIGGLPSGFTLGGEEHDSERRIATRRPVDDKRVVTPKRPAVSKQGAESKSDQAPDTAELSSGSTQARNESPSPPRTNSGKSAAATPSRASQEPKGGNEGKASSQSKASNNRRRRASSPQRTKKTVAQIDNKRRRSGMLTLETVPWVEVFYRRQSLGPTPIINRKLPAGEVELRLVNPRYNIDTKRVFTLTEGETLRRKLRLNP